MPKTYKDICILSFITILLSSFVFFYKPIVNSDIIESVIDKDFQIVSQKEPSLYDSVALKTFFNIEIIEKKYSTPKLSVVINQSHRIPVKYQERHGGLPIYLYKLLNYIVPKDIAHGLWHIFWRLIEIIFFYKFCVLFFSSSKWAFYTSLVYSINVTHLFSNFVFISEPMNSSFLCIIIYWLERNRGKDFRNSMILTGCNFFIRLNFLWIALLFVPYFFERNKKRVVKGIGWVLLGAIPLLVTINVKDLLFESSIVSQSFNILYLFEAVYRCLFDPISFLTFYQDNIQGSLHNSTFLISSLVVFTGGLLVFGVLKKDKDDRILKLFLGFILSLFVLYLCVRAGVNYDLYTSYLIPFFVLFFSSIIYELRNKKTFRIVVTISILLVSFQTIETAVSYYSFGPAQIFSFKHQKKLVDKLIQSNRLNIVSLSERSLGKIEFISEEKIDVIYIYPLMNEYTLENISQVLMTYGKSGTLVVDKNDIWSHWYTSYGPFEIDDFFTNSAKYGILIKNIEVVPDHQKEIYIIDYEIE